MVEVWEDAEATNRSDATAKSEALAIRSSAKVNTIRDPRAGEGGVIREGRGQVAQVPNHAYPSPNNGDT